MKNKGNKGITLVALVITIIMLLILASVGLSQLISDNGLLSKSKQAKMEAEIGEYKDLILMAKNETIVNNEGTITLDNWIEQIYQDEVVDRGNIKKYDEEKAIVTTKEGYVFIISADKVEYFGQEGNLPEVDIKKANVTFKYEPDTWTNHSIKVTASIENKELEIQMSKDAKKWEDINNIVFTENGEAYVRLVDIVGTISKDYAVAQVTKIDKIKPIITSVTSTTNTITIEATDEASGIVGYAVTTTNEEPTEFTKVESTKTFNTTVTEQIQEKTYYVWVKDEAGNVSEVKNVKTKTVDGLTTGNTTYTPNPNTWTNESVVLTASTEITGFTIQTSLDGETWKDTPSRTFTSNGDMYARLWDGTNAGGYSVGSVANIDKTKPILTSATADATSLSISATDEASGVSGYAVTTSNTEPDIEQFTQLNNSKQLSETLQQQWEEKTYYIWVRDEAGNISESKSVLITHYYSDWTTSKEPTCTEKGISQKVCSICGDVQQKEIAVLGHNFSTEYTVDVASTCVVAGSKSQHCTRCDAKTNVTSLPLNSHNYQYYSSSSATCTSSGYTTYRCSVCGDTYTNYSSSLGHNYSSATCTSAMKCTRCGATSGSALGHNYTSPTCTSAGSCTRCGATGSPATGHSYSAATCTKPKTCSVCGATSGTAPGHTWKAATCTKPKTCSVCGATSGEKLGHSYSSATCTKPKTCSRCGATSGEKLGHSYSSATCTKPKTCSRCGATSGEKLGHSYSSATCTKPKTCSRCGATSGSKLGHSYSAATCTRAKKCTRCGTTSGSALGHNWTSKWCSICKWTTTQCSRCGKCQGGHYN